MSQHGRDDHPIFPQVMGANYLENSVGPCAPMSHAFSSEDQPTSRRCESEAGRVSPATSEPGRGDRTRPGLFSRAAWIVLWIIGLALCLVASGCRVQHESSALNSTAQATGEAAGKAIVLGDILSQIESSSPAPIVPLVKAARRAADGVMLSLQSATAERVKAEAHQRAIQQENENLRASNDQLRHAWFTPTQKRLALYAALAIFLLRGLGLVTDGWLGTIASMAAHGILAVATFGISLIVSLGDNAYFRKWFSRKNDSSNPDAGVVAGAEVTQPVTAELATS